MKIKNGQKNSFLVSFFQIPISYSQKLYQGIYNGHHRLL